MLFDIANELNFFVMSLGVVPGL